VGPWQSESTGDCTVRDWDTELSEPFDSFAIVFQPPNRFFPLLLGSTWWCLTTLAWVAG
jgi:hypothetical protein